MKNIFIDMDRDIVDLSHNINRWFNDHPNLIDKHKMFPDHIPCIFRDPKPIKGSIESIKKLYNLKKYNMFIASSSPWGNPESSTDKRYWIEKYFGDILQNN
jgi:5'(3')-deoxyribonucleotidase